MEQFYEKINDPNHNGATFFAVCRGKVEYYWFIYASLILLHFFLLMIDCMTFLKALILWHTYFLHLCRLVKD